MENKVKEIDHCINIIKGVARICGDDNDQLYVLIESYNQLTQEHARTVQDKMRRCRAAVACLIGALVPHEYFESFMEDIGLLEDEIYNEALFKEVEENIKSFSHASTKYNTSRLIRIDDVMAAFDDFMCSDISEEDAEVFLKMLEDRAEVQDE